jgi:hypothetical protein
MTTSAEFDPAPLKQRSNPARIGKKPLLAGWIFSEGIFSLRRVALIYNPQSGQYSAQREKSVRGALAVLKDAGIGSRCS